MHPALGINEVAKLICANFGAKPHSAAIDRKSLLNVALTCRSFLEIALDEIWRVQATLDPLLMCFPAELYEVKHFHSYGTGRRNAVPHFHNNRVIRPEDWGRVIYYAPRIRYLRPGKRKWVMTNPVDWPIVATLRPASLPNLLPNLKEIDFDSPDERFQNISTCLGSNLEHITYHFESSDYSKLHSFRLSFFITLPNICPSLRSLRLTSMPQDQVFFEALLSWTRVETLEVVEIRPSALGQLGCMKFLKKLVIKGFYYESNRDLPTTIDFHSKAFPSLRYLQVAGAGSNLAVSSDILKSITSKSLKTVIISNARVIEPATGIEAQWKTLIDAALVFDSTLVEFDIKDDYSWGFPYVDDDIKITLDGEILRPLSRLANIVHLTIVPAAPMKIVDEVIADLSHHWPHLQTLNITLPGIQPNARTYGMTLNVLVPLLSNCRQLASLDISLNMNRSVPCVGTDIKWWWNEIANKRIESIGLEGCTVKDTVSVALFLSAILPHLSTIRRSASSASGEVERHLKAISVARGWQL